MQKNKLDSSYSLESFANKSLDELFSDLESDDIGTNHNLKIELLYRINNQETFTQVMERLQQSILNNIEQKNLVDKALGYKYSDDIGIECIRDLISNIEDSIDSENLERLSQEEVNHINKMINDLLEEHQTINTN